MTMKRPVHCHFWESGSPKFRKLAHCHGPNFHFAKNRDFFLYLSLLVSLS